MKITRDGKEIELSTMELMDAHSEYEKTSMIDDIESAFEEEGYPVLSDGLLPAIADKALRNLSKCDPYFEAYWESVNQTIKSEIKNLLPAEHERFDKVEIKSDDNISFLYKNVDNEECSFEGTVTELYRDWMGECMNCPYNDAIIYSVKLNDVAFEIIKFEKLMSAIKELYKVDDEDPSIGVNILLNGEPATITLHLYTQKDFMGIERSGIALNVQEADGDYVFTVSLGEFVCIKNAAYIDTNNCGTEIIDALVEDGFAKNTGFSKQSGFCQYPLYVFDEDFLKTAGSAEYEQYEKSFREAMGVEA